MCDPTITELLDRILELINITRKPRLENCREKHMSEGHELVIVNYDVVHRFSCSAPLFISDVVHVIFHVA